MSDAFAAWLQSMSKQHKFERFTKDVEPKYTEADLRAAWNAAIDLLIENSGWYFICSWDMAEASRDLHELRAETEDRSPTPAPARSGPRRSKLEGR